jgi:hypothetical protein
MVDNMRERGVCVWGGGGGGYTCASEGVEIIRERARGGVGWGVGVPLLSSKELLPILIFFLAFLHYTLLFEFCII